MNAALIIPCFNFQTGLPQTFAELSRWRENAREKFQVCFVNDGSTDATGEILAKFVSENPGWTVLIELKQNRGKGAALRAGFQEMAKSAGYLFFTDCDLHYGLEILDQKFLPLLESFDIVIADRSNKFTKKHNSFSRKVCSILFNRLMYVFTGVNVRDTQAGCKGFRRDRCTEVFSLMRIDRFAVDVELLSIAQHYQLSIKPVPVVFSAVHEFPAGSTIKVFRTSIWMGFDLLRIAANWIRGSYESVPLYERIHQEAFRISL